MAGHRCFAFAQVTGGQISFLGGVFNSAVKIRVRLVVGDQVLCFNESQYQKSSICHSGRQRTAAHQQQLPNSDRLHDFPNNSSFGWVSFRPAPHNRQEAY
jgi:hypothetical protein